jgi:hypothetical protein
MGVRRHPLSRVSIEPQAAHLRVYLRPLPMRRASKGRAGWRIVVF